MVKQNCELACVFPVIILIVLAVLATVFNAETEGVWGPLCLEAVEHQDTVAFIKAHPSCRGQIEKAILDSRLHTDQEDEG